MNRLLAALVFLVASGVMDTSAATISGSITMQGMVMLAVAGADGDGTIALEWITPTATEATGAFSIFLGYTFDFKDPLAFHLDRDAGVVDSLYLGPEFTYSINFSRGQLAPDGVLRLTSFGGVALDGKNYPASGRFTFTPTATAGLYSFRGSIGIPEGGNTAALSLLAGAAIVGLARRRGRGSLDPVNPGPLGPADRN